jgi:poly(A) polymerase
VIAARLETSQRTDFLNQHAARRAALSAHIERIKEKRPLLPAGLLTAKGIEPGKEMGILLKEAERLAIELNLSSSEEVLQHLQKTALWKEK